ncbi:rhomboid family intramembrane serine protease [Paenibacillus baekrokdamisoli]|uniref:Rhomboid family intramembrane serine protease n=1 Tax=Paenibacillus baekrokdamisoli TaxID=1712516 RepID=A0A3G9IST2_9BACL|nr:rhomboid family intramembrane serine protease [Paenibacillus baekrokdamisoli]BBH21436.1 rhomboid family intramembrane serine protease [Paenibacillus baekrokdamisoli]
MIFLRYESFRGYLRMYPVTAAIIAINIIVFILDLLSDNHSLLDKGMFYSTPDQNHFSLEEPWRYVTAVFMHIGFQHLFFNMFAILVFAPPLERMLGHVRYAVFYLLCGIAGNFLSAVVEPTTAGAGASGAIYGIYGAYLYLAVLKKTLDEGSRKTVYTILIFGLIYSVFVPGIGIWAHVGGLIAGFVFAYGYDRYLLYKDKR